MPNGEVKNDGGAALKMREETIEECAMIADAARDNDDRGAAPYDSGAGAMGYRQACRDIEESIRALARPAENPLKAEIMEKFDGLVASLRKDSPS